MKLEENMYVRSKNGKIRKIISLSFDKAWKSVFVDTHTWLKEDNIIDLIKKDDIILGKDGKIYQVWKICKDYVFTYTKNKYNQTITLVDYQIDKVLTKEQFENNCYKVGD